MSDEQQARDELARLRAVMDRLGMTEPLPGPEPTDAELDAEADRLMAAVAADRVTGAADAGAEGDRPSPGAEPSDRDADVVDLGSARRRRRRVWTLVAGAAAAVLVAAAVTVLPHRGTPAAEADGPPVLALPVAPEDLARGGGEPAAAELTRLADAAAARAGAEAHDAPVQHTVLEGWAMSTDVAQDGATTSTVDPVVAESWLAPDGSMVRREWRGPALGPEGQLEPVDTAPSAATVDRFPAGTFDAQRVADLPREPGALRAALLDTATGFACADEPSAGWCLYAEVTQIARAADVPPDLEAALWQVLAAEPGFSVAGDVTDRLGRRSVAVAVPASPVDAGPVARVLLIDAATGRLSGWEEVLLPGDGSTVTEPTVRSFDYAVASDRVASAP